MRERERRQGEREAIEEKRGVHQRMSGMQRSSKRLDCSIHTSRASRRIDSPQADNYFTRGPAAPM